MGPDTTRPGPRERRKRRTHEDLLRSALELFLDRGYSGTTVGDIAERAAVSERTFFRYFAGKEELVLHPLREARQVLLAEVARRPAEEEPLRALCEGGLAALRLVSGRMPGLYLLTLRVVSTEPEAHATCLRFGAEEQRTLADVVARRERARPDDLRPVLLAAAFTAAITEASLSWGKGGDTSIASLSAAVESHLRVLPQAVTWGRSRSPED